MDCLDAEELWQGGRTGLQWVCDGDEWERGAREGGWGQGLALLQLLSPVAAYTRDRIDKVERMESIMLKGCMVDGVRPSSRLGCLMTSSTCSP